MYYPLGFDQGVGQCAVSVSTKITAPSLLSYMSATTCTTTHNSTQGEVARELTTAHGRPQQHMCCTASLARCPGERGQGRNEFIF